MPLCAYKVKDTILSGLSQPCHEEKLNIKLSLSADSGRIEDRKTASPGSRKGESEKARETQSGAPGRLSK
jgi:hypothetical protein